MFWDERGHPNDQVQRGFKLIGASIKRRRLWLHWTQRHLEAVSGIDQSVISRIENGRQFGLRWGKLAILVDALGGLDVPHDAFLPPLASWNLTDRRPPNDQRRRRGDPNLPLERVALTGDRW
jgi:transcriptional regulator with XRE-family HTH domain